MRYIIGLPVAAALLMTVAVAALAAEPIRGPAEIIDGDTMRVAGTTVRLDGIDAPESSQECEDGAGRSYAFRCKPSPGAERFIGSAVRLPDGGYIEALARLTGKRPTRPGRRSSRAEKV